ncbi:sugar phosphate isomerase/epimerase family protein [Sciscionella sediminilitoris]|uniref:sugar phosphate isomerase/epimerase family protein n=1 Tax=Sciscionella sediminilitoris TaxID=1445613 RepID=UPI0004DFA1A5|nr:sugar phosphate isomerase/epimerase family protein [Sciscionella sp. SE31]
MDHVFPNPLGVHSLVWTGEWTAGAARDAVRATAACGYDLLELTLHDTTAIDTAGTRNLLAEHGVEIACSRGLSFEADLSSTDAEVSARGEALLDESLRVAGELGARYLCGALYGALGKYPGPASARGRAHVVAGLTRLAGRAADLGITLGLEVVNRYESNLVNTAEQALALIAEVDAPNLMLHLDTYHMNIEEPDLVTPVLRAGERLGYVHIGENHRGYLGSGHLDFGAFFHALAEIGYAGPVTFESFSSAVVSPGLTADLAIWRDLWTDGADLAAHAQRFIAGGLEAAWRR